MLAIGRLKAIELSADVPFCISHPYELVEQTAVRGRQ